jgi:transcriptional regulator GlxA family with amidase domain
MHRARYSRPTDDPRLETCALEHSGPLPPGWLAPGYVANLVIAGEAELHARGVTHRVHPGVVVLSDAGEFRRVVRRHTSVAVTRSLTIAPALLAEALATRTNRRGGDLHFRGNTSADPRVARALRSLYDAIDTRDARLATDSAVERFFDALATDLHVSWSRVPTHHPAIRRVRALIDDRCADDLSLGDLTDEAGLSRAHLIRAFTRDTGVSPHQYLIHARVRQARGLLAAGASAARTAAATGFFDQSHLTRCFTRYMGVTPVAYQRALRHARGYGAAS